MIGLVAYDVVEHFPGKGAAVAVKWPLGEYLHYKARHAPATGDVIELRLPDGRSHRVRVLHVHGGELHVTAEVAP